jgi:hypothetical protein
MRLLEYGQIIREVEHFLCAGACAGVFRMSHRVLGRQAMKVLKGVGISLDDMLFSMPQQAETGRKI